MPTIVLRLGHKGHMAPETKPPQTILMKSFQPLIEIRKQLICNSKMSMIKRILNRQVRAALAPTPPPSYLEIYPDQQVGPQLTTYVAIYQQYHHLCIQKP